MTPDDWRRGMENEAASVEDAGWAGDVRRHLRYGTPKPTALLALAGLGLSIGISAAAVLGTQLPVLTREAAHNGTDLATFVTWNVLGNPQPIETISHSSDPAFPSAALLAGLFIFAALATRARWPHWLILLCPIAGTLTVATLTNLVLHDFSGFPASPLLTAVCVAALGIVLGLPLQQKRVSV